MKHILLILLTAFLLCACTPATDSDTAPLELPSAPLETGGSTLEPAPGTAPQPTETGPAPQMTTDPDILETEVPTVPPAEIFTEPPQNQPAETAPSPTETTESAETDPALRSEELPFG